MPRQIDINLARTTLRTGALGVGERHNNDDGRRFVCELLKDRVVHALFLEAKSQSQYEIEKAKKSKQAAETRSQIAYHCNGIMAAEQGATIFLASVAAYAVWKRVPVYCIDVFASDHGAPWLKNGDKEAVEIRDKKAAELFNKCVNAWHGGNRRGCVVLFGEAHFTGTNMVWAKQHCLADELDLDYVLL